MQIPNDVNDKLIEIDKKLLTPFIERVQLVLGLDGLELVRYGTGENDPENDQGWDFYTRRIDTKEVVDTGVSTDEILFSGFLIMLREMTGPPVPGQVV